MKIKSILLFLSLSLSLTCCGKGNDPGTSGLPPVMDDIAVSALTPTSVTLDINSVNTSHLRVLCLTAGEEAPATAKDVVDRGTKYTGPKIVVDHLAPDTRYTVWAVPCSGKKLYGEMKSRQFTTPEPGVTVSAAWIASRYVELDIVASHASCVYLICLPSSSAAPDVEGIVSGGTRHTEPEVRIEGLTPETAYTVYAVACDDAGQYYGKIRSLPFTTDDTSSEIYPWEASRSGILSFTDLVLCYGGSPHRVPGVWSKERFEPFVTYVDEDAREHWLFDSFLCLEFVNTRSQDGQAYDYGLGYGRTSAGKVQWQEQIDFWFGADNGVNALEQAVEAAASRLGAPPTKRKVIISMPDAIIHRQWLDAATSTTYWGSLNGRTLDFSKGEDRVAAYRWFANQIRKRFDQGNYRYVELAGFYIISEELVSTDEGWERPLKKSWEVFPAVADYLHTLNEAVCWIPYNRATGYSRWQSFGIDYAYMQPNYFWNGPDKPLSRFFADIASHGLAMEFEFDDALLEGQPDSEMYRNRLRDYMAGCISHGVYGTRPLSYYQGDNTLYNLWQSTAPKDREMYHEFCRFVLGNPLRE